MHLMMGHLGEHFCGTVATKLANFTGISRKCLA